MSRSLIFWLALLFVFSGAGVVWTAIRLADRSRTSAQSSSEKVPPPGSNEPILKEFTLTERDGTEFHSGRLDDQVWVASFFFASCPGSCRAQNLELMTLQNEYAKKGVKFVSITCDPKTDTPGKLREYAQTFQALPEAWYFLTGDLTYIRRIGSEIFSVWVDERGHMDRFMTVDKWGNVRGHFDWHDKARLAELKAMLDKLLAETEPPADLTPVMATAQQRPGHTPAEDQDGAAAEEGGATAPAAALPPIETPDTVPTGTPSPPAETNSGAEAKKE